MRYLLGAVIIVGLLLGAKELYRFWEEVRIKHRSEQPGGASEPEPASAAVSTSTSDALPALPPALESSLEAARRQGAVGLKAWLNQNRGAVQDPRLAAIELDYVIQAAGKNFGEAREVFAAVKRRTPTNSPVYPRIKKLERAYE